jgi:hypothetical protein
MPSRFPGATQHRNNANKNAPAHFGQAGVV